VYEETPNADEVAMTADPECARALAAMTPKPPDLPAFRRRSWRNAINLNKEERCHAAAVWILRSALCPTPAGPPFSEVLRLFMPVLPSSVRTVPLARIKSKKIPIVQSKLIYFAYKNSHNSFIV
jgi:hypothetical protein